MDTKSTPQLEFLLATLDNLNDAILVVDRDGTVLYTNHGFEEIFKHLVGDIVEWTFEEMGNRFDVYDMNGQYLPPSQWPFVRIMQGKKVFQEKFKVFFKANNKISLFIQISGGPIKQANSKETYSLISVSDITTQETNYLLLQEKEENYRKLFLDNPQPMWIIDLDTLGFMEVNNAALAQYGYSNKEFLNLSIEAIIHEENLPKILDELQKSGQPLLHNAGIRRHYKKNGEIIDVEVTSHYLTYEGKRAILSMPHDITARKRAETKLMESEEKLSLFIQHAPAALAMFDCEMRYIAASKRWLEDNKVSLKEIIGTVHYDVVPDIPEEWKKIHQRGLNGEYIKNDDDKFLRQDGSVLFLKWEVRPWFNAEKEIGGIILITEDITTRKQNEEKVRIAFTKYKTLFDNIPVGISISDSKGKIIETNSIAEELLGISEEEHKKRKINDRNWQIFRADGSIMPSEEFASVRAINSGKKVENVEMGILKPDKDITWVNVTAAPITLDDHGVIVAFNDITARKKTEKKLIESEKRFATIFHDSPIPIAIIRLKDGEIILTNPSVTKFLGYTHEELIGNTTLTMGIWANTDDRREFIKKIHSHSRVYDMEAVLRLKSGEKRHALMWGELIEYYGEECILLEIIDIHEKKIQEEKIRMQNEKLNAILHSLPDKLFIHDAEGTFLEAYTTSPDGYMAPKESFLGKKISDIFPKEIAELNLNYLRKCLQRRETVTHEFSTDYKETYSTFEVRVVPFMNNKAIRFVRDITKSKENEREIFKLNKAIDNSPIAIVITDTKGVISYASSAFESMTGYSIDEVLGQDIRILDSGKHPKDLYIKMWQTIESGNIWEGEMINRKKNGTFYWVYLTISPLYENEKQITGYLAVQQDITEKKKSEQKILELNSSLERRIAERTAELQENQDKLMLSQRIAQLGIWEFNTHSGVVKWSDETYKIFECSPDKPPYSFKEFIDTIHPEDREQFVESAYSMTGEVNTVTFTLRHYTEKGNLKWVKYYIKGVLDEGEGHQFMSTLLDITAEKKIQLQLQEAVHEAEEANNAKSIFLANMSHEIRTPLNSIIGFSELLYNAIADDKKRSQITSIRNSGRNLLRIINDILDLSKVEAGKIVIEREPINLMQVVGDVCGMFETTVAEKKLLLTIASDIDSTLPLLMDETRLRQILFNLVGNAIKFTAEGGVTVDITHELKEGNLVDLKICISDTGMGISEDQLEAVFEPFVQQEGQGHKYYGGTGLGLTISRRMAEAMNGEISVKSKLNKGSEFSLFFRDIAKTACIPGKSEKSFHDYMQTRFEESTILIVDDIEDNRKLLLDALEHTGARLLEAKNGLQAIETATKEKPDLILMDKRMPVMNGKKACKMLKENPATANIVCIGVSATIRIGNSESDSHQMFDENILKPISYEKLFEILIKYLKNTQQATQPEPEMNEALTATVQEWSDALKQHAREELLPLYRQVMSTQLMDEMEDFGRRLAEAGRRFDNKKLIDTGNRIVDYADQFEVKKLTKLLKEFEVILNHEL
ncbi:MAG: PAS domain S-box protein [bacterium]|nr:PAS domain S-box protein [bacterium]